MGIFLSYQSEESSPLEECVDSLLTKSFGSGKFIIEGSLSFKRKQENDSIHVETEVSIKSPRYDAEIATKPLNSSKSRFSPSEIDPESPKHEAAVKLQKVYKSFRTRRQLADCAVLVDQHWWKVLDFALLKRSSVSFFDIDKPESVVSKWSRARTRAAKVGKGLSKDENAKKLALQHWLEAIDPRHRYGHNLHYYYDCWLHCDSKQPFFYWLDVGEGKEVNLEKCPRLKLQQQCIKYLGPKEREAYEVIVENGKLIYKQSQELIDTSEGSKNDKWIFVLSTSKTLYVGQKKKGKFQHSSFLAGGATSAAGRLVVENGILKAVWPHSGHYRPTEENFQEFMSFLKENNVDLTDVKLSPSEDDDEENSDRLKSYKSELNLAGIEQEEEEKQKQEETEIPTNITETDLEEENIPFEEENILMHEEENILTCEEEKQGENTEEQVVVPKATILQRINSKKGLKSYQLGKQLSLKWSTGAGPRIGFVRDYPSEIQIRALEEVSLSPRCAGNSKFFSSPSSL